MSHLERTPLERWTAARIGLSPDQGLTTAAVRRYQLDQLAETLAWCRQKSPFYRDILAGPPAPALRTLSDSSALPFTTPADIQREPLRFLCVSQSEVARVVTLKTSGTTGPAKRIFYTDADLEATVDFFHHGMATLTAPGQRVLILLPGPAPDSVGDLLSKALGRMAVKARLGDPFGEPEALLDDICADPVDCIVGTPWQLINLVRRPQASRLLKGMIKTVLLSTDYVPRSITAALSKGWGCRVFQHYGMTEMGYGGAVDCSAQEGYHLREPDLLFEIVDPQTGRRLPEGRTGEVVFSTLTRRGMPLLRYRTGDLAFITSGPCPCGSMLRRMSYVRGRLGNRLKLGGGIWLTLAALDEALFSVPDVVNYTAAIRPGRRCDALQLTIYHSGSRSWRHQAALERALGAIKALQTAMASAHLCLAPVDWRPSSASALGPAKRHLLDLRKGKA